MALDTRGWLDRYTEALALAPITDDDVETLLALAGVAAHASERTAAPVTCYLAALSGVPLAEALAAALPARRSARGTGRTARRRLKPSDKSTSWGFLPAGAASSPNDHQRRSRARRGPFPRMGASKATLAWHGSTLVDAVAGIVARSVRGPVVVVRSPGQACPFFPPSSTSLMISRWEEARLPAYSSVSGP